MADAMTKSEWLERATRRVRALHDEARVNGFGQLAYLLEGAAREAEAQLPGAAPKRESNAYTPQSLADRWQCSANLVRTLIARGDLEAVSLGGKLLRISRKAVAEFEARPAFPNPGSKPG